MPGMDPQTLTIRIAAEEVSLAEKLESLPTGPGVYQHKDPTGKVLYVGKAKNLRARVRSYFNFSDGRFKVRFENGEYDLRVSVLPTSYGETCCLRILNRSSVFADLDKLGLSSNQLPKIRAMTDLLVAWKVMAEADQARQSPAAKATIAHSAFLMISLRRLLVLFNLAWAAGRT